MVGLHHCMLALSRPKTSDSPTVSGVRFVPHCEEPSSETLAAKNASNIIVFPRGNNQRSGAWSRQFPFRAFHFDPPCHTHQDDFNHRTPSRSICHSFYKQYDQPTSATSLAN